MRKSQLTMVMIVGIVLFVLVGLLLYLSKTSVKKQVQQNINRANQEPKQSMPFKEHVQQCLDDVSKEAITTITRQGGYLYSSQGGPMIDFLETDQGILYISHEGYRVSYNIYPARSESSTFSSTVPRYPWQYFPYSSSDMAEENFEGIFGINSMPALNSFEGPSSIQSQIEASIENRVKRCINIGSFTSKGFSVTVQDPDARVTIGKEVSVRLFMPITWSNLATGEVAEFRDFSAKYDIRLQELYLFSKNIINRDTRNVRFNITDAANNRDGFTVQIVRRAFNSDDIIKITDERSLLGGRPLEYKFSRKNRPPALHYIPNDYFEFDQNYTIRYNDIITSELRSEDPDEDETNFSVKINGQELTEYILEVQDAYFTVEVSDGSLLDYQTIHVARGVA